jgi:hypothetical protein
MSVIPSGARDLHFADERRIDRSAWDEKILGIENLGIEKMGSVVSP